MAPLSVTLTRMASAAKSKVTVAAKRVRLAPGEREGAIVAAAARVFADQGFGATTREIAARLGVTQALLYRYFPSKEALIDAVMAARFDNRWKREWDQLLADRSQPLEQRLIRFYENYRSRSDSVGIRLWVRAGLDGRQVTGRFGGQRTRRVFAPIMRELRHESGLPEFATRGLMRGEREIAMVLHASVVFINIRKHVYRMPMPDNVDDLIALYVRTWLPGAIAQVAALHRPGAESALTVRVAFAG